MWLLAYHRRFGGAMQELADPHADKNGNDRRPTLHASRDELPRYQATYDAAHDDEDDPGRTILDGWILVGAFTT